MDELIGKKATLDLAKATELFGIKAWITRYIGKEGVIENASKSANIGISWPDSKYYNYDLYMIKLSGTIDISETIDMLLSKLTELENKYV